MNSRICALLQMSALVLLIVANDVANATTYPAYTEMSGKELYMRFCSSCHGIDGHGDGSVAASLDVLVPDLTLIERRHRGKFPPNLIEMFIDGRFVIRAHGVRNMPAWGEEFTRAEIGSPEAEAATRIMIRRMVEYLESIQQVAPTAASP